MTTTTVTVKYVNPPKDGKKRGTIKTTDDQFIGVWADKIHLFEVGKTYEIELSETKVGTTTYQNVKTVKMVASPEPAPTVALKANSGSYNNYREMSPKDAEGSFVCATLGALIRAGEVKNDKAQLWATTNMLRALWQHTFGQANEPQAVAPAKAAARR